MNARQFLTARMRAEGVTQKDLARRLGITDRAVRYLLTEPGRIRTDDMVTIADKLHLTDKEYLRLTRWKGGTA